MQRSFLYYSLFACLGLFWISCANIMSPTGGAKDVKAPVLKKRSLPDSSLNFAGGKIDFDFDEFVQLKDVQNQLIITPLLKTNPKVTVHKKRVTIQIEDSLLEKNTTYSLSMGNAISDLREGNIYPDLNFTFSTGSYFDSLSLKGKVIEANTGKADSSSIVVLYDAALPDSAFFTQKPLYIQKTISGNFFFKNLPSKEFSVYALSDANKNLHYDQLSERIAFYDTKVKPKDSAFILLHSFVAEERKDTSTKKKTAAQKGEVQALKPQSQKLNYFCNADTSNKTKRTFDINDSLKIKFDQALKIFDETKIRLYQGEALEASAFVKLDSARKVISIYTQWNEDAVYSLKLLKGFAQDSSGLQTAASELTFKTKRKSDYGFLNVQCKKDEKAMIELLQNDKIIRRKNASDTLVSFSMLNPDNYQIRILHDANQNGVWDTGSFWGTKHQPELVELYNSLITIKANWENKINLEVSPSKKQSLKK